MSLAAAADAWCLVGIVVLTVLASEAASFAVLYRRPDYKRVCERVKVLTKKFEKEEAKLVAVDKRKMHEKVVSHLEEEVKKATTEMNGMKFKTNIASSLAFFVLYRYVSSSYSGTVVARLPFLPFKMLSNFTHRGIDGDDLHDCGFGLIYSLATMAVKQNVPKLLGFTAPRSAFDPSKAAARAAAKLEADS